MPKIETLAIGRFRALKDLRVEGFGRINLITGRNNTGKSSVLEALRILAANASPAVITDILHYREEDFGDFDEIGRAINGDGTSPWSSLFHGFPSISETMKPIVIESSGLPRPMRLVLQVGWFTEERDPEGVRRMVQQQDLFGDEESVPLIVAEGGPGRRLLPLDFSRRYPYRARLGRTEIGDEALACVFVSPYGGERTATLGILWDKIALSDRERDVVEALKIIDSGIEAVSMVGGEGPRQSRTAIVRAVDLPRPVPLRSFGDGLNRLFGIVLSLVNAKGGLLLIDEFENGMHHSVQLDAWRVMFRLARRLDVQVFATSHSWDSIEAFQMAAAEDPDEGVLIRLTRRGEDVVPTVFSEQELAVVTRDHIEVR